MRADSLTFACVKCKDYSLQRETKKGGGGDGGVEGVGGSFHSPETQPSEKKKHSALPFNMPALCGMPSQSMEYANCE